MPNTTPIPELIALEIVDRLQNITTDNGFNFDVSEVIRPTRRGENWTYQHLGIGVVQGESTRVAELDLPGNPPAIAWQVQFRVQCIVRDDKNETAAHATNENEMAAAAVQAIVDDGTTWYRMNDNAIDTQFGNVTPFVTDDAELNGASVPVLVTYRVSETNPFEVR